LIALVTWMHAAERPIEVRDRAGLIDFDCRDFATQAKAQAFFQAQGLGDPYWLDFDGDGRACEFHLR